MQPQRSIVDSICCGSPVQTCRGHGAEAAHASTPSRRMASGIRPTCVGTARPTACAPSQVPPPPPPRRAVDPPVPRVWQLLVVFDGSEEQVHPVPGERQGHKKEEDCSTGGRQQGSPNRGCGLRCGWAASLPAAVRTRVHGGHWVWRWVWLVGPPPGTARNWHCLSGNASSSLPPNAAHPQ